MVSMIYSFYGCNIFFLCLSGVVTITHGMVVALMSKSSFLFALFGFNDFFLIWNVGAERWNAKERHAFSHGIPERQTFRAVLHTHTRTHTHTHTHTHHGPQSADRSPRTAVHGAQSTEHSSRWDVRGGGAVTAGGGGAVQNRGPIAGARRRPNQDTHV